MQKAPQRNPRTVAPATNSRIAADGLHFVSKVNGSPFQGSGTTYSCLLCGKHRVRTALKSRKFCGRNQLVCAEGCKATKP